jgi:hypothetical protein
VCEKPSGRQGEVGGRPPRRGDRGRRGFGRGGNAPPLTLTLTSTLTLTLTLTQQDEPHWVGESEVIYQHEGSLYAEVIPNFNPNLNPTPTQGKKPRSKKKKRKSPQVKKPQSPQEEVSPGKNSLKEFVWKLKAGDDEVSSDEATTVVLCALPY